MNEQKSPGLTSEWIEHRRADDNELIGFLVPDGERLLPVTVFGYPIAASAAREAAEEELDQGVCVTSLNAGPFSWRASW